MNMKKGLKFWNIVFCCIFILLCVVSMVCVMSSNSSKKDKGSAFAEAKEALVIDDFEGDEIINSLGSKSNVYVKAPSKVMVTHTENTRQGKTGRVLLLRYAKENEGGPYGRGGWCGFYTLLKNETEGRYFDASNYKYLSFWVKGEVGDENFNVGLSDRHWDKIGDSLKSEEIIAYIEGDKIPTKWTYVRLSLEEFFLDHSQLASITINFEGDCFPEGKGSGIVYIDDIMLEK